MAENEDLGLEEPEEDPFQPLLDALDAFNGEQKIITNRLSEIERQLSAVPQQASAGVVGAGPVQGGAPAEGGRLPGAAIDWRTVPEDQYQELWDKFVDWVLWLADEFELSTDQLPRQCWYLHGSARQELTALWTGWESAYNPTGQDAAAGPYLWHDALARVLERLPRMYLGECANGYHQPRTRVPFTGRVEYRDAARGQVSPPQGA
ncbi:hypothetical protein ACWC1D_12305 [Streptomyces sp. NPDC001478]